jgi:predicted ATPase
MWLTGAPEQALHLAESARALGQLLGHAYSHAVALYYAAMTYQCCGRTQEFASCAGALIELSVRHSMEMLSTEGRLFLGRARFEHGEQAAGIDEMRSALASILATGEYGFAIFYSALLADALIATGELTEAHGVLQRAVPFAEHGQGFFLPEIYRLLGELRVLNGDSSGAWAQWDAAATIAAAQGAVSLTDRIGVSRARLQSAQAYFESSAEPHSAPPKR